MSIEKFKQLLQVYNLKDTSHFNFLLNRAEECRMDIPTTRKVVSDFVAHKQREQRSTVSVGRTKEPEPGERTPKFVREVKYGCPTFDCGGNLIVVDHVDLDGSLFRVGKCKVCQYSTPME